jgi:hypothetical protein
MKEKKDLKIYQLKITLSGSEPAIWRRFAVDSEINLSELHYVIQIVMGWDNSHLHQYRQKNVIYGEPQPDLGWGFGSKNKIVDENDYKLNQVLTKPKDKVIYEYDFGDSWEHELVLEKILEKDQEVKTPVCLEGAMACPPEDCGGIGGYYSMLEIIKNPEDPEYESMMEWLGNEFDPDKFDLKAINKDLKRIRN